MAAVNQYLETQVLTAPPEQLHLLVVDGALRFARLGLQALGERNYDLSHESFSRSREFVNELITGLRVDGDEAMVHNLQALFGFVHRSLNAADGQRDAQKANDAITILKQHRETWVELMETLKQQQPAIAPADDSPFTERDEITRSWLS